MKHAILATDLSGACDRIIGGSEELKKIGIGKITLVHVLNLRNPDDFAEFDMEATESKIQDQKRILEGKGFVASTMVVMGSPAFEVTKLVGKLNADLLVIGSIGRSQNQSPLGSTASEILHHLQSPVMMFAFDSRKIPVGSNESPEVDLHHYEKFVRFFQRKQAEPKLLNKNPFDHVLFTTDFSDFSEGAFQWLNELDISPKKLTLMHVQDEIKIKDHLASRLDEFNRIDQSRLERLRDAFLEKHSETGVEIILPYGSPKKIIVNHISEGKVSLTIMGSQGRGYISGFFLGSVSFQVARNACSHMLIIPMKKK
jgi:nucleotide-binding universal stress UspA family protein